MLPGGPSNTQRPLLGPLYSSAEAARLELSSDDVKVNIIGTSTSSTPGQKPAVHWDQYLKFNRLQKLLDHQRSYHQGFKSGEGEGKASVK